jgi:hypothetical protein
MLAKNFSRLSGRNLIFKKFFDIIYIENKERKIYMNYTDDILARLQNGESVNTVARELTDSLNKASSAYAEQQKAKAEAEKKAAAEKEKAALKQKKSDAIVNLIDSIAYIFEVWGIDEKDIEELCEISDHDVNEIIGLLDLSLPLLTKSNIIQKEVQNIIPKAEKKVSAADPVQEFLDLFVR